MTPTRDELREKVSRFPSGPGVYRLKDAQGQTIYVGKAARLRDRVRSYLREGADDGRLLFPLLVRAIRDVDCVATTNEKEALILENELIKREKPRYNVRLTDDKTFLSIEIADEPFPRARLVRRPKKGARAFGPYSSAQAVRETLRNVRRTFPLRTCSNAEFRQRTRPCIEHDMGRCGAPCVGLQSEEDYARVVEEVVLFLKGKDEALLPRLEARMKEAARALDFERAARLRDQIAAIEATLERQRIARAAGGKDQDALGVAARDGVASVYVLSIRGGRVAEARAHSLRTSLPEDAVLDAFLGQYYADASRPVPQEILLPAHVEDRETLEQLLRERTGVRVEIKVAPRGERRDLLDLARRNAELALETGDEKRRAARAAIHELRDRLGLAREPRAIEGLDVSTIQGTANVASCIRFEDGFPAKGRYRQYRVLGVVGQDDFACMAEVVSRRARRGLAEGDLPDLMVIDGGKGQLAAARAALREAGVEPGRVDVVGLAKARPGEEGERAFERVFVREEGDPIVLEKESPALELLVRVRDEAHRFAVTFHRRRRQKLAFASGLEGIRGVGEKRRLALMGRFGSVEGVKRASVNELSEVVPLRVAEDVKGYFAGGSSER